MSSPNIKRLVWTLSVVFLFSALASWPVRANDEDEFEFTGVISSLPNTAGFIGDWVVGGRNPDDAPDGSMSGYNLWLNKVNQFNGNFVSAEMVKAFIQSNEYGRRFGPLRL